MIVLCYIVGWLIIGAITALAWIYFGFAATDEEGIAMGIFFCLVAWPAMATIMVASVAVWLIYIISRRLRK